MRTIETERLILSDWKKKDAADLFEYAQNPNVGPHAGWKPHENVKESKQIIKTIFIPGGSWAIREKQTGKAIGSISLEPDKYRPGISSKELGYSLSEEHWGKGIMTEAAKAVIDYGFKYLKLEIIAICTGPENQRSQSVIRKCGFTYEGTLRRAYKIYDGTERDVRCYSLMKTEYDGGTDGN